MPKLTDTQTILLSTASQRADLSFYPLPETHAKGGPRVTKALAVLVSAGFAEEREADMIEQVSRSEGDVSYGLFATGAGLAAIAVEPEAGQGSEATIAPAPDPAPQVQPRTTKSALLVDLLQRDDGATLPELIAATGWLPHTTRAALTGLRKKGHVIERTTRDNATCYVIPAAA